MPVHPFMAKIKHNQALDRERESLLPHQSKGIITRTRVPLNRVWAALFPWNMFHVVLHSELGLRHCVVFVFITPLWGRLIGEARAGHHLCLMEDREGSRE